jgi:hypothetical protein
MRHPIVALYLATLTGGSLRAAEVPQGSHLLLRLVNSINTRTARDGDYVYFRTATPIVVNGQILVPVDSYAQGVVSRTKQSGRVKGRAELGIRIETLTLPSGRTLKISPHLDSVDAGESAQKVVPGENEIKQGPNTGADAERIAKLAGTGAAIGGWTDRSWSGAGIGAGIGSGVGLGVVLLTRGRQVELRQGSTLDVVFERAVDVD